MITTKSMLSSNKLKIKFACKRIEADPGKKIEVSSMAKSSLTVSKKRGPSEVLQGEKVKKLKMDRSLKLQCSTILKTLMTHKDAWAFSEPVDPVKLNIPDYFCIISHPMDLGTIKTKLEKNMYSGTEEFAADVRLTFANAMLYNPPGNVFHQMANDLNKIFEMRWSVVDGKLNHGSTTVEPGKSSSGHIKKVNITRQNPCKTPPLDNMSVTKRSISCTEKVRIPVGASDDEAELSKTRQNCTLKLLAKNLNRGTDSGSRQAPGTVNAKQSSSLVGRKCGSCGNIACRCRLPSDSSHLSLSDISSERSLGRDHHLSNTTVSRLDCQATSLSTSQMSKSDPESDGAVSALDGDNVCSSPQLTTPVTDAASGGWGTSSLLDVQLSPTRALRAAKLKSRFADTIWKAQQEKLLDHGDRSNPLKMQQIKAKLEKKQREEKERIEAEVRAAEAASRMRAELELKQERERKREEARIALEKMRRTVEIETSLEILSELERLVGFSPSTPPLNRNGGYVLFGGAHLRSPLEQFGLFIKAEYSVDEVDESILNGEEGEIF